MNWTHFGIVAGSYIAVFLLGTFEGANLWALVKGWFVKEVTAVETKIAPPKTQTGVTGATGA